MGSGPWGGGWPPRKTRWLTGTGVVPGAAPQQVRASRGCSVRDRPRTVPSQHGHPRPPPGHRAPRAGERPRSGAKERAPGGTWDPRRLFSPGLGSSVASLAPLLAGESLAGAGLRPRGGGDRGEWGVTQPLRVGLLRSSLGLLPALLLTMSQPWSLLSMSSSLSSSSSVVLLGVALLVWEFSSPPALCNVLFFPPKTVSPACRPCERLPGALFPLSEIPQQCLLFPIPRSSKNFQVLFSLASPSKCIQVWQVLTTCTLASWVCCLNGCNRLLTGLHPSTCAPSLSLLNTATRVRLPARRSGCVTPQGSTQSKNHRPRRGQQGPRPWQGREALLFDFISYSSPPPTWFSTVPCIGYIPNMVVE